MADWLEYLMAVNVVSFRVLYRTQINYVYDLGIAVSNALTTRLFALLLIVRDISEQRLCSN